MGLASSGSEAQHDEPARQVQPRDSGGQGFPDGGPAQECDRKLYFTGMVKNQDEVNQIWDAIPDAAGREAAATVQK
jgi:hypothetical protein